ncbi:MAG: tautomerase family protein [Succinivibrio sp.]|nr:tautomerase family protein [Succinivibrio sp.]
MPYISIECGQIESSVKKELIKTVTEVSSKIMNVLSEFFTVTIKELPDSNFGIGGRSIGEIKEEYKRIQK